MQNVAEDPVRVHELQTRHPDEAAAMVRKFLPTTHFRVDGYAPGFQLRLTNAIAGPLVTAHSQHGFGLRIRCDPLNYFTTAVLYRGSASLRRPGRSDLVISTGRVWRFSHDAPVQISYSAKSAIGALALSLPSLGEAAAESTGDALTTVRFLDESPTDDAAGRYWAQLVQTTYRQALAADSVLNRPLIRAHVTRTLAKAALLTFPNSTMTADYVPGTGYVGPTTLRRAVTHLHAHAGRPLTLTDLAKAAGITPRALQKAFLQHYDCSPMTYLRRVRLEGAHRDLQIADPAQGDRVGTIAARWGFSHLGRFGTAYQQRYGVAPSTTLRG